jgi:hypothetical protein
LTLDIPIYTELSTLRSSLGSGVMPLVGWKEEAEFLTKLNASRESYVRLSNGIQSYLGSLGELSGRVEAFVGATPSPADDDDHTHSQLSALEEVHREVEGKWESQLAPQLERLIVTLVRNTVRRILDTKAGWLPW